MFKWIVASSLRLRFLVLSAAAALVAFGSLQLSKMPVDVFPEFAPPMVEVQTEAIGLSADEVESMITYSLEELLSGVPWIESTRSRSVTGLSSVLLIFKRGTDVMKARQMVQERLAVAYTLPNVATPPVILQPTSSTSRFMMVALSSDTIDSTELSLLARWTMKPKLVGVPGVSNVSVWGQRLRQLHVHFDSNRLRDSKVTQDDIMAATGDALWVSPLTFLKASSPGSGGWIDNSNQRLGVEHAMPIESPEDLAKVAVTSPHLLLSGRSMALGDVAETTFAHSPVIGDAIVSGGKPGLMLVIEKFPGANTLEVTRNVEQALSELKRGLPGIKVESTVFRLADYVEDSVFNLNRSLVIAAALVVLVVAGFMTNWRSAVVAAVSLPVSLLAAVLALRLTGTTLNTMILTGLVVALGVVIDSAVVDVYRLKQRLLQRRVAGESALGIIFETTLKTQRTALYATLIVALATLPVFFMTGVAGAFFEPLALSYLLAVLASMVVALTVTPALALALLGRSIGGTETDVPAHQVMPRWLQGAKLHERYGAALAAVVGSPRVVVGAAVGLVVVAAAVWPVMGQSLLPPLRESNLTINWSTPPGTSHAETFRITSRVSQELEKLPGVKSVGAHIGRAVTGDQVVGINSSQMWVALDGKADREKTLASIRETLDGYPGIEHNLQSYLRDKVGEAITGQSKPIVVRIYGPKRDVLKAKAEEVRKAMASVPGIVDLAAEGQVEEPYVQVKVNLDAAGKANVKPGDVRRSAASVFSGMVVGYLFKDQRIFEVVVWGAPEMRQSLSNLRDLWVEKSDRSHARLGDIAEVNITSTPTVLSHEGRAPYVDVVANVDGQDPSVVIKEVAQRLAGVNFPLEYHPEILGEFARGKESNQRVLGAVLAALVGILLLLQACHGSWKMAGVAGLCMAASVGFGVLAVAATGGGVSIGAVAGLLAVLGIAARQSMTMIGAMQELQPADGGRALSFAEQVGRGVQARLVPVLASMLTTGAALLPLLAVGAIAGFEIIRPAAIVMAAGLVASTLMTLFLVPAMVQMAGSAQRREIDLSPLPA